MGRMMALGACCSSGYIRSFELVSIMDSKFLELEFIVDGVFVIGTVWRCVTRRCWTWRCTQRSRIVEAAWIKCIEATLINVIGIDGLQCLDTCLAIILKFSIDFFLLQH